MGPPVNAVKVTRMSIAQYKALSSLCLTYGTAATKFGRCLAAIKDNALCYLSFYDQNPPLDDLKKVWGKAVLTEDPARVSSLVDKLFNDERLVEILLKGTDFEVEVWEALLKVKKGATASYEDIARAVARPKGVRAVARAVAKNNVGYLVPCHRIIKKNGSVHKYRSGAHRKVQMLRDEGAID